MNGFKLTNKDNMIEVLLQKISKLSFIWLIPSQELMEKDK
jgi:hypothetical protein